MMNQSQGAHAAKAPGVGTAPRGVLWVQAERVASQTVVAAGWHDDGMNRIRLSTTVNAELLITARSVRSGTTDAALIDEALRALLARNRSAEVDASYAAYDEHPVDEPDEWGDLASWRRAAGAS